MGSATVPHASGRASVDVGPDPIVAQALLDEVADDRGGATVLFFGTVRDHSPGRSGVTGLEYEAYDGVVEAEIAAIASEAMSRWEILKVAVAHRTGSLSVGEITVGVAVSASHRDAAFPAGRYLIDELKSRAPIWKKEHWEGGAEWVQEGERG